MILIKTGDQVFRAVLDTGATLSIVARRLLKTFKKPKTVAIRVGDGCTIHSLGEVDVTICLGDETVTQHSRVWDTDAFDIVIGTDFLRRNPQVKMLSLQRPYYLHCDFGNGLFSVPLKLLGRKESRLRYASKTNYCTENYQLACHILQNGLAALQVNLDEIRVELFASRQQHIMQLYCSKHVKPFCLQNEPARFYILHLLEKNPSVVFLLCADLNIGCSKTKSSNDNPRHTARQINSTSVLISITVHSTEIVTIPKHTKTMYITGIHNSCMSQHNYIPTKSDVFIIKQSFIKANSVHKSVRAHALQCPKRRHLHCNAKQHNIWVYVTYMCQYSQVLSTIP